MAVPTHCLRREPVRLLTRASRPLRLLAVVASRYVSFTVAGSGLNLFICDRTGLIHGKMGERGRERERDRERDNERERTGLIFELSQVSYSQRLVSCTSLLNKMEEREVGGEDHLRQEEGFICVAAMANGGLRRNKKQQQRGHGQSPSPVHIRGYRGCTTTTHRLDRSVTSCQLPRPLPPCHISSRNAPPYYVMPLHITSLPFPTTSRPSLLLYPLHVIPPLPSYILPGTSPPPPPH
jgi:hypothetical protein